MISWDFYQVYYFELFADFMEVSVKNFPIWVDPTLIMALYNHGFGPFLEKHLTRFGLLIDRFLSRLKLRLCCILNSSEITWIHGLVKAAKVIIILCIHIHKWRILANFIGVYISKVIQVKDLVLIVFGVVVLRVHVILSNGSFWLFLGLLFGPNSLLMTGSKLTWLAVIWIDQALVLVCRDSGRPVGWKAVDGFLAVSSGWSDWAGVLSRLFDVFYS